MGKGLKQKWSETEERVRSAQAAATAASAYRLHTPGHISAFFVFFLPNVFLLPHLHMVVEKLQNGDDREQRSNLGGGNCQMVILLKCSSSFGKLPPFLLGLWSPLVWKWAGSNPGGWLHASGLKPKLDIFQKHSALYLDWCHTAHTYNSQCNSYATYFQRQPPLSKI